MNNKFRRLDESVLAPEANAPTRAYSQAAAPAPEQAQARLNELNQARSAFSAAQQAVLRKVAQAQPQPQYNYQNQMQPTRYDHDTSNTGMRQYGSSQYGDMNPMASNQGAVRRMETGYDNNQYGTRPMDLYSEWRRMTTPGYVDPNSFDVGMLHDLCTSSMEKELSKARNERRALAPSNEFQQRMGQLNGGIQSQLQGGMGGMDSRRIASAHAEVAAPTRFGFLNEDRLQQEEEMRTLIAKQNEHRRKSIKDSRLSDMDNQEWADPGAQRASSINSLLNETGLVNNLASHPYFANNRY